MSTTSSKREKLSLSMKIQEDLNLEDVFSDGLHQAIEAKEGLSIQKETQTHATVTLQNYFRFMKSFLE